MFQPLGVIFRLIKYESYKVLQKYLVFYKPEDDPKGLKHVASLIVYNSTLHHIIVV